MPVGPALRRPFSSTWGLDIVHLRAYSWRGIPSHAAKIDLLLVLRVVTHYIFLFGRWLVRCPATAGRFPTLSSGAMRISKVFVASYFDLEDGRNLECL